MSTEVGVSNLKTCLSEAKINEMDEIATESFHLVAVHYCPLRISAGILGGDYRCKHESAPTAWEDSPSNAFYFCDAKDVDCILELKTFLLNSGFSQESIDFFLPSR